MNLPKILQIQKTDNEKEINLKIFISSEIIYFKGHFSEPGTQILPGIVQVDWVIEFCEQFLGLNKENVKDISQVKFTRVIVPNSTICVNFKIENNILSFRYYDDNEVVFSTGKLKIGS